ncbi:MAG: hypothetical protein M0P57_14295 [Syntrophales bacterium]|jgi:hypothetical protein|nr:hypothetical protein [Syntrophales bacterium]
MKILRFSIAILCTCAFIFGCSAPVKFIQTGNLFPPHEGPVKVFTSPPTDIQYEEIGLVASSGGIDLQWTHLIEAMQKEASAYGANAIILISSNKDETSGVLYTPKVGLMGNKRTIKSLMARAVRIY